MKRCGSAFSAGQGQTGVRPAGHGLWQGRGLCRTVVIAALVGWSGSAVCGLEDSADERFLAGLRDRGLFQLAEAYCAGRLAERSLSEARRAELVIEWSRTLAEHARNTLPDQRGPLWEKAWQIPEQFSRLYPESPWWIPVRLQGALALLARGELARQESDVLARPEGRLSEARRYLRQARDELERLVEQTREAQRAFSVPGPRRGGLSHQQLVSLEQNIQFHLARAYRNQGQSYPAASADRANALSRAAEGLRLLAALPTTHPLGWPSRIEEIVCYRLLEDATTTTQKLAALNRQEPPPAVALRARAEALLLALHAGEWDQLGTIMDQGRRLEGITSPELDYAWLKAYLDGWRAAEAAGQPSQAAELKDQATNMVRIIHQRYGAYWIRRAQMLVAASVQQSPGSPDLAMWIEAAENAFRSGQDDEALEAYDRARSLAVDQGDAAQAFQLGKTAAAIETQRGRHAEASDRYRALALAMPTHPEAPEVHWSAVWHAAQAARGGAAKQLEHYAKLLEENLQTWPEAETANRARWRLGQWHQYQGRWAEAIAAYQSVTPDFPEWEAAIRAAEGCYAQWLAEREAAGEPTEPIAVQGAEWFESLVSSGGGRPPPPLNSGTRVAALAAARLRLDHTPGGPRLAETVLTEALTRAADAPQPWKAAARALLATAQAAQGKLTEAEATLQQLASGPPGELLRTLDTLAAIATAADPPTRRRLGQLALRVVQQIGPQRSQLAQNQQQTLDRLHARALADAGRTAEALRAYDQLAKAFPRDGTIQESYATLLATQPDRGSWEAARDRWREVARRCPTASPRWFRAKYALAELAYRLGQPQKAATLIRQLQILHPELGGPDRKRQFLDLLDRCRASSPNGDRTRPP